MTTVLYSESILRLKVVCTKEQFDSFILANVMFFKNEFVDVLTTSVKCGLSVDESLSVLKFAVDMKLSPATTQEIANAVHGLLKITRI